jgi:hypothetical protein
MARSTPPAAETNEVVTPLQMILTGTLLISMILAPLVAFGLYLSPLYKAPGALYRGTYFMIGLGVGVLLAAVLSVFWMSYLPGLLVRREQRQAEREVAAREERREAGRKARAVEADAAAATAAREEE